MKKTKIVTCIVLAMVMCFSVLPTFASTTVINENNPAPSAITKHLNLGVGAETPEITFTFDFVPVSFNKTAVSGTNMPGLMPAAFTVEVEFDGEEEEEDNNSPTLTTVTKTVTDLFNGIVWPRAGVYVFNVTENAIGTALEEGEIVSFSQAEYQVSVYVANGSNDLYIAMVAATITQTDDGENGNGEKVETTPGGTTGEGSPLLAFNNSYTFVPPNNEPEDFTLKISKEVTSPTTGALQDHDLADREQYFDFVITVSQSAANTNTSQIYKAYVLEGNDTVVTSTSNILQGEEIEEDDNNKHYIEFTPGEARTIRLKHGQWISFTNLEVGATYTVNEIGTPNYTPSLVHTVNSGSPTAKYGTLGQSLSTNGTVTLGDDIVAYTNTLQTVTPVGIAVDNLPYAILIGLGLVALVLFVVVKSRRKEKLAVQ